MPQSRSGDEEEMGRKLTSWLAIAYLGASFRNSETRLLHILFCISLGFASRAMKIDHLRGLKIGLFSLVRMKEITSGRASSFE